MYDIPPCASEGRGIRNEELFNERTTSIGKKVFANGMEVAHRAGSGKVIAAFPDVCNSPPPPPAGPLPVPYPNTSRASDLKKGSKKVKVGGKPTALKDQSFYRTSPLGNEASTKNFGASLLSHTNVGKTYFQAYSMDVVFEGKKVCRHLDITTSNHASYPGSTPPMPNTEAQNLALERIKEGKCPCCKGPKHADGEPMNRDEWYKDNAKQKFDQRIKEINVQLAKQELEIKNLANHNPRKIRKAVADYNKIMAKSLKAYKNQRGLRNLIHRAKIRPGCTCPKPPPPILPAPPCDVFYKRHPPGPDREAQQMAIDERWNKYRQKHVGRARTPRALVGVKKGQQVNHLTPKSAGGCPTGDGNLQSHEALCSVCQRLDKEFSQFQ